MNNMQVYSKYVISVSLILILSIFTIFSISEVQAAENIFVNAKSFENTIIIEFENGLVGYDEILRRLKYG